MLEKYIRYKLHYAGALTVVSLMESLETQAIAMIVDPDVATRMRLKQATTAVHQFKEVRLEPNLTEAQRKLEGPNKYDVVFVSERFPHDDVVSFVSGAKGLDGGIDAAYILVLGSADQDSAKVASSMVVGTDGFLLEPYSVDQLVEIVALAQKVRKERQEARQLAAVNFLVKDIMAQLDRVAYLKACQVDVGRSIRVFRDRCKILANFDDGTKKVYFDTALTLFEKAPIPKAPPAPKYIGASRRVRQTMEKKVLEEVKHQEEAAEKELGDKREMKELYDKHGKE